MIFGNYFGIECNYVVWIVNLLVNLKPVRSCIFYVRSNHHNFKPHLTRTKMHFKIESFMNLILLSSLIRICWQVLDKFWGYHLKRDQLYVSNNVSFEMIVDHQELLLEQHFYHLTVNLNFNLEWEIKNYGLVFVTLSLLWKLTAN